MSQCHQKLLHMAIHIYGSESNNLCKMGEYSKVMVCCANKDSQASSTFTDSRILLLHQIYLLKLKYYFLEIYIQNTVSPLKRNKIYFRCLFSTSFLSCFLKFSTIYLSRIQTLDESHELPHIYTHPTNKNQTDTDTQILVFGHLLIFKKLILEHMIFMYGTSINKKGTMD